MRFLRFVFSLALLLAVAVGVLVFIGWYEVAADKPHAQGVEWFAEQVRDRSIEARARGVQVPKLDDEAMVRDGAGHYAKVCAGCHMAPGDSDTSFPDALYPRPPRLTATNDLSPAQQYWVIKHGIKLSAMPAWGATHNDRSIWNIVAFLQRLPTLTPEQYRALLPAQAESTAPQHGPLDAPVQEPTPGAPAGQVVPAQPDEAVPKAKPDEPPEPKVEETEQHETRP